MESKYGIFKEAKIKKVQKKVDWRYKKYFSKNIVNSEMIVKCVHLDINFGYYDIDDLYLPLSIFIQNVASRDSNYDEYFGDIEPYALVVYKYILDNFESYERRYEVSRNMVFDPHQDEEERKIIRIQQSKIRNEYGIIKNLRAQLIRHFK